MRFESLWAVAPGTIPTLCALCMVPATTWAATLQVGPGKPHATLSSAVAAAVSGDVIEVDSGMYDDDIVSIDSKNLTIRGVGDTRPHFRATAPIPNGKGIIVALGTTELVVERLEFSGAAVVDDNGAGIRMQGASLVVEDCLFHDNQNGILAGAGASPYTAQIRHSEFHHNGIPGGDGQQHNVYIGDYPTLLVFEGNYSHHAYSGQALKSRALESHVLYNRLMDEADGTSSYLIDLSQGGLAYVVGNVIQQGPMASNHSTIIAYKPEGPTNPDLRLFVVNNTIVNDNVEGLDPAFVRVWAATDVVLRNNIFVGWGTPLLLDGGAAPSIIDEYNVHTDDPGLVDRAGYDYRLVDGSVAIDAAGAPGSDGAFDLTPTKHYVHPAGTEPRPEVDALDIGAYEFGMGPPAGDDGGTGGSDGGTGDTGDGSSLDATGADSTGDGGSTSAAPDDTGVGSDGGTSGAEQDGDAGGCACTADPHRSPAWFAAPIAALALRRRRAAAGPSCG